MEHTNHSLDPTDWSEMRALGHRMMDDMIDHLAGLRNGPVWQKMPDEVRANFKKPLPAQGTDLIALYADFTASIKPYVTGNTHPRFFGWVHGGGNPVSMLADFLAGAMNANCGGRDHVGIAVERQVIAWSAEMLGMPTGTSGVLLTGSSMANFCAVLCARFAALGEAARREGFGRQKLVAYASAGAHRCVPAALDMAGFGSNALRLIPVDKNFRMDVVALQMAIVEDRAAGKRPFLIVGTAGSVDTGAIDDLDALADIAERSGEGIWFHVDAAFGALAALSPAHKPALAGIERADSVAFDFHKWAQVTYDAGCLLVRDAAVHLATFQQATNYLAPAARGMAAGQPWPCDLGPDLSRGFRALKIWMTISAYGSERLGGVVAHSCDAASRLAVRVRQNSNMEVLAPVPLNIVCLRIKSFSDEQMLNLVAGMQENGLFVPSTTTIGDRLAIRVAVVNHRTSNEDVDAFFKQLLRASGAI